VSRALVIIDHGSRRPEAHRHLEWIAEQVRQGARDLDVFIAHLELAEPSLETAIEACARGGASDVLIHPLFLLPGRHLSRDLPSQVKDAAARHPGLRIRLTEPLGKQPGLAQLILGALESHPS